MPKGGGDIQRWGSCLREGKGADKRSDDIAANAAPRPEQPHVNKGERQCGLHSRL
jgi:hypothetical protein